MKETLVSAKTAERLKDIGFDWETRNYTNPQGEFENSNALDWNFIDTPYPHISIPTQSLAQKYLREVHNTHVEVYYASAKDYYCVDIRIRNVQYGTMSEFETFEEALEEGIIQSIKIILK